MHVFLKPKNGADFEFGDQFQHHSRLKLSTSCRQTLFSIQSDSRLNKNCCRKLHIFNDIGSNKVKSEDSSTNNERVHKDYIQNKKDKMSSTKTDFYECKIVVKGFKDQLIKGRSIWT